jgi:hypothetical protein
MNPRWLDLFREQQALGFPDLAGTRLSLSIPVSDRLITRVIAENLPASSRLRHLEIRAENANRLRVVVQLARPAFMPTLTIPLDIERQPSLPGSPVLSFRVASSPAVMAFAGSALRFLDRLPAGIVMDGNRVEVDLRLLAARYGAADAFEYLESIELTSEQGRVILSLRAALPPPTIG